MNQRNQYVIFKYYSWDLTPFKKLNREELNPLAFHSK